MSPTFAFGLVLARVVDRDLGQLVLDLVDDAAGAKDADATGLGVDPDVDVLVTGDAPVRRLDAVLDGSDQLLTGDLLLRVELEEGADEVSTHDRLLFLRKMPNHGRSEKKTRGSPTSGAAVKLPEVYTRTRGGLNRARCGGSVGRLQATITS